MTTTIEVNRRHCGQFEEHHSTDYSIAWYCWVCGEVYARRTVVSKQVHWDFYYGVCLDCAKKDPAIASGGWWQFFRTHDEVLRDTEMPPLILAEEFLFNVDLLGVLENVSSTRDDFCCGPFTDPWAEDPPDGGQWDRQEPCITNPGGLWNHALRNRD